MGSVYTEAPYNQQWTWVREGLEEVADYAGKHGVILGLQNHSPIMQSYRNVLDMVNEVGSDNLKITLDAPLLSQAGEPMEQAVREVGKLMVHSHTSDADIRPASFVRIPGGYFVPRQQKAVSLGDGEVDLKTFVNALKKEGYQGYLAYEICGPVTGGGGEENLDKYSKNALSYMRELVG